MTLSYPEHKKQYFSDYPVLPQKRIVQDEELGCFTSSLMKRHGVKNQKTAKLIADLHIKRRYKIHYTTLKQVVALGVEIEIVHRVIRYEIGNIKSKIGIVTLLDI